MRVAIDAGGTFTDVALIDATGRLSSHKVLSHPEDPARGMLNALDSTVHMSEVTAIVNGTTAGLNAVLSRRGTRVLVITTAGFGDVLAIGRAHRHDVWELRHPNATHLVEPGDVHTVTERMLADGTVQTPLDDTELGAVSERILAEGLRSVAICFLHATVNPAHELAARVYLAERHPDVQISMSHVVAPEVGEFERFSSTVVNAYVATTVGEYLERVTDGLTGRGHDRPLMVMRSSGGVTSASSARARPMQTLLSGPAGGVVGAQVLARALDRTHLLALDMGGTSLDASVIVDKRFSVRTELDIDGLPILMPVVDLATVSAGGGSIAWSRNGALHVGPHSAGASPGPACYGRGGTEPTVTDANVVLGRLGHAGLANDALSLDRDAARRAYATLAEQVGGTAESVAQAVLDITDARMTDALRTLTIGRGHDPREFAILAFGGAGPLHAASLADDLDIATVIIPPAPGVFSAWGMLHAPVRHDLAHALLVAVADVRTEEIADIHARLVDEARRRVSADGVDPGDATYLASADLRYAGQQFAVTVDLPLGSAVQDWDQRFRDLYVKEHGTIAGDPAVEFVNLRVIAVGPDPDGVASHEVRDPRPATTGTVVCAGEPMDSVIWDRASLDAPVPGPAVIHDPGSTIFVPPSWVAAPGPYGTVVLTKLKEHA
jgi:N-methylhydantoinase A